MPTFLKQSFEQLIQYWSNRSSAQRMLLAGAITLHLLGWDRIPGLRL